MGILEKREDAEEDRAFNDAMRAENEKLAEQEDLYQV